MIAESVTIQPEAASAFIERAIAGDEVAFARIVAAHHGDMSRVSYLVSGSAELAEDAVQVAWAVAWRRLGTLRDPSRLRPWLMSIAANEARQMARSSRRRTVRELVVVGPTSTPGPDRAASIDLGNALAQLDPRDRVLIGLRYVAGLGSEAIGREIGMSASGVRVRMHRLMGRLRAELGDD